MITIGFKQQNSTRMGHSHKTRYICLLQTWDSIDFPCGSPWKHLSARPLLRCREGALGQSLLPRTMAASKSQTFWKLESLGDGMLQSLESLESRNIRPSLGLWDCVDTPIHLVGSARRRSTAARSSTRSWAWPRAFMVSTSTRRSGSRESSWRLL